MIIRNHKMDASLNAARGQSNRLVAASFSKGQIILWDDDREDGQTVNERDSNHFIRRRRCDLASARFGEGIVPYVTDY